jgi:hypothetical protein
VPSPSFNAWEMTSACFDKSRGSGTCQVVEEVPGVVSKSDFGLEVVELLRLMHQLVSWNRLSYGLEAKGKYSIVARAQNRD